ncbi:MAG: hypothetical protein M1833_001928 [Piccolia ochrophora]|nr:MAG: hypothetical protein M1833_001928 [Piccolia ochrophora]
MPLKLDSAIVKALGLDAATTTVASHGGSGFSTTAKITTTLNGEEKHFFMKTGQGQDSTTMFKGEHASLNAIHSSVPTLCPASFATGLLTSGSGSYLVTDFLDMSALPSRNRSSQSTSLAAKLAKLHTTPAPPPPGETSPAFGFPTITCCGSTEQENPFTASWVDFYANSRLRTILAACERNNGGDSELHGMVEKIATSVVPRLLGDGHLGGAEGVKPVVVHGDLWSGNKGSGKIGGKGDVEEVVFDPSACYAHSEYELGIMNMFGGFNGAFWKGYHELVPKTEPVAEYEDRVALYELYHHLNHHALFGGGYRGGAMSIMKKLCKKYGAGK